MSAVELRDVDRSERPVACCRESTNLRCEQVGDGRFIEHCTCGRRHHIMEVEPGLVGLEGAGI